MTVLFAARTTIHYLPIATTVFAAVFCGLLVRRYREKGQGTHLLWWAFGVACYGLGTGLESVITLWGNSLWLNKCWYIAGALLGAYPLAQGTVYLLFRRRTANLLSAVTLPVVATLAVLVVLSPADLSLLREHQPSGDVIGWNWLRMMTPIVNGYAALMLVGGAMHSAWRFAQERTAPHRVIGNLLIAVGAILPGIGGMQAKMGTIETLYVTELVGLILIWAGYMSCVRRTTTAPDP